MQVSLTPLQSHGSFVPAMWSGQPDLMGQGTFQNTQMVECPDKPRAPIQATTTFASITNPGQKLEAVRCAIIKAFASHVYGLDGFGNYIHQLVVTDLGLQAGHPHGQALWRPHLWRLQPVVCRH